MINLQAPYHAHIYYSPGEREMAAALREAFNQDCDILFAGTLTDRPIGPHPLPQFEVHFLKPAFIRIVTRIKVAGLRALVHPLTDDDLADHTRHARWIGLPLALDKTMLDPPGMNKGVARFGKRDF